MQRRNEDALSVQETKWKDQKARRSRAGFKMFCPRVDMKKNGVEVILKSLFVCWFV